MIFKEFNKKGVFITGAASGIGQAQATAFIQQGAYVFGFDKNQAGLIETAKKCCDKPGQFSYAVGDVSKKADVLAAVMQVKQELGSIDILLNTAGLLDAYKPTLEVTETEWKNILAVNLGGVFLTTNAILPDMLKNNHGVIINMTSIAGFLAGGGGAAYTASKHAIVGYTKQLDYDYCSKGIRVNGIAPGAIKTPMNAADFAGDGKIAEWVANETPAGRWAQPSEVADLTLFLASHHADYLHGSILPIDGGWMEK